MLVSSLGSNDRVWCVPRTAIFFFFPPSVLGSVAGGLSELHRTGSTRRKRISRGVVLLLYFPRVGEQTTRIVVDG